MRRPALNLPARGGFSWCKKHARSVALKATRGGAGLNPGREYLATVHGRTTHSFFPLAASSPTLIAYDAYSFRVRARGYTLKAVQLCGSINCRCTTAPCVMLHTRHRQLPKDAQTKTKKTSETTRQTHDVPAIGYESLGPTQLITVARIVPLRIEEVCEVITSIRHGGYSFKSLERISSGSASVLAPTSVSCFSRACPIEF